MLGDIFKAATSAFGLSEEYKGRKQADKQFKSNQREAIQWRVKDAQKAGIHPLFALGASVGSSPTTHVGSTPGAAAEALGESVSQIGQKAIARKAAAQAIKESEARIAESRASATRDTAEAMYTDAQRATLSQKLNAQGRDLGSATVYPLGSAPKAPGLKWSQEGGLIDHVPPMQDMEKSRGMVAGLHPGRQEYIMPDGTVIETWANSAQMDELKQMEVAAKYYPKQIAEYFNNSGAKFRAALKRLGIKFAVQKRPRGGR